MVTKICKVCGKEFDAKGRALCCSIKCKKINKKNSYNKYAQSEKGKAARKRANKRQRQSDKYKEYQKEYRQSDKYKKNKKEYYQSDRGKAAHKKYQQSERCKTTRKKYKQSDRGKAANKKYQQSDKGKATQKRCIQKKIAELNEKFDGDLDLILKDCPTTWLVREAIMLVEYGVSYSEAMYKKIELNPVCEITGRKDNLVIHHLDSFNLYPEKGADLDNLVRVASEIHDDFHNEYGRGNNTREQWFEFLEKKHNIYI